MTNAKKAKQQHRKDALEHRTRAGASAGVWIGLAVLVVLLAVAAVLLTGGGGSAGEPAAAGAVSIDRASGAALAVGEAIPDWSAPSLDGSDTIRWADFVGTPTVIAVWAPWCPHCQEELPRLAQAMTHHPDVQLVTISTAVEQSTQSSQGYLDSKGLSFPVAVDDAALTLRDGLGVGGYPTLYLVNADGTVFQHTEGEIGLQPDGSMDPSVLDGMLGALEAANA